MFNVLKRETKVFRSLGIFLAKFGFLLIGWKVLYHFIWTSEYLFSLYYDISISVINVILLHTKYILQILGQEVVIEEATRVVKILGTSGVTVGEPCIGIDTTALFIGLVFSYGSTRLSKRISFSLIGVTLIYLFNLARITTLAMLVRLDPYIWEINHKYIFKLVIYSVVFGLWVSWVKKSRESKKISSNDFLATQ